MYINVYILGLLLKTLNNRYIRSLNKSVLNILK